MQAKRFKTNPVELGVFLMATLIFGHAVYGLFYENSGFRPTVLTPMATSPVSEGRLPAAVTQAFLNLDVRCDSLTEKNTSAMKVRLAGSLCGIEPSAEGSMVTKTLVINNSNKFNATVFTDPSAGKFSTDYIPLTVGKNSIHLEFSYRDGKNVAQDIIVNRN